MCRLASPWIPGDMKSVRGCVTRALLFAVIASLSSAMTARDAQAAPWPRGLAAPTYRSAVPNVYAGARDRMLNDVDIDVYISPSLSGPDRRLARQLMSFMPPSQRGDFVYLDRYTGRTFSNNPALLRNVRVTYESRARPPSVIGRATRQSLRTSPSLRAVPMVDGSCSPPNPPPTPQGAYSRVVSPCTFSAGWGFVDVACLTTAFANGDTGYLYMELTGPGGSESEGGFQYNGDTSIAPWLRVNGPQIIMTNNSVRYGCGQQLVDWSGATPTNQLFTEVGQLPASYNPQTAWITEQTISLANASWLFTSAPSDINGAGTDAAGASTPCTRCSISKVTTIAQSGVSTYSVNGSYFGVDGYNQNAIEWNQVAFGDWGSNCYSGTTLCTFYASADPTQYFYGIQGYPNINIAQADTGPTGYGPYESFDGVSLNGSRGDAQYRAPAGSLTEPLPPLVCSPDAKNYCAAVYSTGAVCHQNHGEWLVGTSTYHVYSSGRHYLSTATDTIGNSSGCSSNSWSPADPKVTYSDSSLP